MVHPLDRNACTPGFQLSLVSEPDKCVEFVDQEDKKIEPIPASVANSAGFLLNRTARIIHDINEQGLTPLRLSPREFGFLRILSGDGPLSQHAIGKRHNIDRTTVVQIVDALEKRDLVNRVSNENDRRSNLLYLTPRGKKTLAQALRIAERQQQLFLEPLAPEEWETLKVILKKLILHHLSRETP